MNKKIFEHTLLALSLLLITSIAFTATATTVKNKKKSTQSVKKVAPAPANGTDSGNADLNQTSNGLKLGATAGFGLNGGALIFGAGFRGDVPVDAGAAKLRIGGETGLYRYKKSIGVASSLGASADTSVSAWAIPVVGTVRYDVPLSNFAYVTYVRAAVGVAFAFGKGTQTISLAGSPVVTNEVSASATHLHLLIHPGMELPNSSFFVELPFGLFGGGFHIFPTLGMTF